MATPLMGLDLPIPHVTSGTWGDMLNAAFLLIDAHDHSPGQGAALDFSSILSAVAPLDVSSAVASAGTGLLAARDDHSHHIAFAGPATAGIVATTAQTFAGVKTFSSGILAPGLDVAAAATLVLGGTTATEVDLASALVLTKALGNFQAVGTIQGSNLDPTFTGAAGGSAAGTNTGDITLAAVGAIPAAEGASLVGQVLTLQPADATFPGVVTELAQTFGGVKTFSSAILTPGLDVAAAAILILGGTTATEVDIASALVLTKALGDFQAVGTVQGSNIHSTFIGSAGGSASGANTGDITLTAVGAAPSANGAVLAGQALTLEPADATTPGVVTALAQSFGGAKTFAAAVINNQGTAAPAGAGSVSTDASLVNSMVVSPAGATSTISNPTNPATGQFLTYVIKNATGAPTVTSWDTAFKMAAWVDAADGFSAAITFLYNGANWVEVSRGSVSVPN